MIVNVTTKLYQTILTESNFLVESAATAGLFGDELFRVKEDSYLSLIGSFGL